MLQITLSFKDGQFCKHCSVTFFSFLHMHSTRRYQLSIICTYISATDAPNVELFGGANHPTSYFYKEKQAFQKLLHQLFPFFLYIWIPYNME
jgi:hypothetical protein